LEKTLAFRRHHRLTEGCGPLPPAGRLAAGSVEPSCRGLRGTRSPVQRVVPGPVGAHPVVVSAGGWPRSGTGGPSAFRCCLLPAGQRRLPYQPPPNAIRSGLPPFHSKELGVIPPSALR